MADQPAHSPESEALAGSLLLYAVEMTGDPGAAEDLIAEATSRVFRWTEPDDLPAAGEALFKAVTALAHGPLNRAGRPPLPANLRAAPDRFDEGIETALAELAGRDRAALFLVTVERLSYERAAAVLGTTAVNVSSLVWRARRILRGRLVGALPATDVTGALESPVPSTELRISKVLRAGCAQTGLFLSCRVDGQLTPRQREVLEPHVSSCGVCSEELARIEQVSAAVRGHWEQLAGRLAATGGTRKALGTLSLGRRARARGPNARRVQMGAIAAALAGLVVIALIFALLGRGSQDAIVAVNGEAEISGGRVRATGPAVARLIDGTEARLEAGCSLSAARSSGTGRPRVKLLAGAAEFAVSPGSGDLVVESAAGSCRSSAGTFSVRLAARGAQGRPLDIEFGRARALAPGERLAMVVESQTAPVVLSGQIGKELGVAPGCAGLVPVSDTPRPLAVPGSWVGLQAAGGGGEPSARSGAALGCDRGSGLVALFGGMADDGAAGTGELNDLWAYDPALGSWQEMSVSSDAARWLAEPESRRSSDRPAPQLPGALIGDPRDRGMWLYSGRLAGSNLLEMWFLEVPGNWQRAPDFVPPSESPEPAARGGRPARSTRTGKRPPSPPPSLSPLGRQLPAMAASGEAGGIVLFGGALGGRAQGDTWLFDSGSSTWKPFPIKGASPEPRTGAAMAADAGGKRVYLFGGRGASGAPLGDTWCLNVAGAQGGTWQHLAAKGAAPEPRTGATMACEELSGRLVLFGGRPRLGGPTADTWVLEPETSGRAAAWSKLATPGAPAADEFSAPALVWHPQCRTLVLFSRGALWGLRLEAR